MTDRPTPYAFDDPTVIRLGRFLENTPLSNNMRAPLPAPLSQFIAQAVTNYTLGLAWDADQRAWIELGAWEATADLGDIHIENVGDGGVVRMIHRSTGVSVLGENHDDAYRLLMDKVRKVNGG
ncbi:hypothetical protein [Gordonia sputi]